MYTFHNLLAAMHLDYGVDNFKKRFPYHWLRSSWYHYLNLLDIDHSTGFPYHPFKTGMLSTSRSVFLVGC